MNETTFVKTIIGAAIAIIAIGCSGNPGAGSEAYKQGDLGKGGFLFGCSDGAACRSFSGDAAKFPKTGVASGSTFGVRFVANENMGRTGTIDWSSYSTEYEGTHVTGLTPYLNAATGSFGGIAAIQPGIGTLVARTADGSVIDVISLPIVKAAKLAIYDADDDNAVSLQKVSLGVGDTKKLRIVAQSAGNVKLAGSLTQAWTSDAEDIANVEDQTDGVATFAARKVGTANFTVTAGGLTQSIPVEVK